MYKLYTYIFYHIYTFGENEKEGERKKERETSLCQYIIKYNNMTLQLPAKLRVYTDWNKIVLFKTMGTLYYYFLIKRN